MVDSYFDDSNQYSLKLSFNKKVHSEDYFI
jgi:hypothetical protein